MGSLLDLTLFLVLGCAGDDPTEKTTDPGSVIATADTGCVDADGDGSCAGEDCDDGDPAIHPGADDPEGDGVDADCDGADGDLVLELADQAQWAPQRPTGEAGHALLAGPDIDGDGLSDVIVGAPVYLTYPYDDAAAAGYVTALDGTAGVLGERWGTGRWFAGTSLAWGGDLDGDGLAPDVAIWGWGEDEAGQAWVVPAAALAGEGELSSVVTATIRGLDISMPLREPVAISPDLTGDGLADLVANMNRGGPEPLREVRIFAGPLSVGQTVEDAAVVLEAEDPLDAAGVAFAGGDLDGDGASDLLIGATDVGGRAGRVYALFGPLTSGSLGEAPVRWDGGQPGGQAGMSLAEAGDIDGDGRDDALVGAPLDERGGDRAGRAFLVGGGTAAGTLDDVATATFTADQGHRFLGFGLAAGGDIDGDGAPDVLVGAPDDWYFPEGPGEVWVYPGPVAGTLSRADAWRVLQGAQLADSAGSAIAAADLDGDGRSDIAVGAPGDDGTGYNAGRVYLVPATALDP